MSETSLLILLGGLVTWLRLLRSRRQMRAWQDAATSCGLRIKEASFAVSPRLIAQMGPVPVRIEPSGKRGRSTRIVVEAPRPPDFDAETRQLISRVNDQSRLETSSGEIRAELSGEKVPVVLPLLLDLGRRFAQAGGQDPGSEVHLQALGHSGAAAVDALAEVMAREKGALAAAAAETLGEIGSPAAERPLILALLREQTDLQVAAANALGRIGSVAAVLPLQDAGERFWLDLKLRKAIRQAIAEIQSRAEGALPGQLSLTQAEEGQLALADDPAGQLSLPPEERP